MLVTAAAWSSLALTRIRACAAVRGPSLNVTVSRPCLRTTVLAPEAMILPFSRPVKPTRTFPFAGPVTGVNRRVYDRYLTEIGWTWTPTMLIGQGCTVHLHPDELPSGRLIVRVSKHICAVIDGVTHDTHDPSRGGTRCVYGYWQRRPCEVEL